MGTEVAEGSTTMTVPGGQRARAAHAEELIPGISDEITLDKITTKLPWKDLIKLVLVSHGWLRAIRSRQVYNARVRSNSRDGLIMCSNSRAIRCCRLLCVKSRATRVYKGNREGQHLFRDCPTEYVHGIILFSGPDFFGTGSRSPPQFDLPPIPNEYFDSIVDASDRSVALDGKVYVFGGMDCKVHVFDVAGHGRWKQCASMIKPREDFGSGVIDGKIYVFGGAVNHESVQGRELYNPKEDTWSPVRPIVSLRCGQHVGRVPDKFLVADDRFYNTGSVPHEIKVSMDGSISSEYTNRRSGSPQVGDASLLEEYDPIQDEWRLVEPVGGEKGRMFICGGKFYSMSPLDIYVYDFHVHLWTHLHSCSFAAVGSVDDSVELWPIALLTVDHEILALLEWPRTNKSCLVQTSGLGNQNKEMVWQKAEFAIPYEYGPVPSVHLRGFFSL